MMSSWPLKIFLFLAVNHVNAAIGIGSRGKLGESCAVTGRCEVGLTCIQGLHRCLEINCVADQVQPLYDQIDTAFKNVIIQSGGDPTNSTTFNWPVMAQIMKKSAANFPLKELQTALSQCPEAQQHTLQAGFTPIAGGMANAAAGISIVIMLFLGLDINGDIGLFFQWCTGIGVQAVAGAGAFGGITTANDIDALVGKDRGFNFAVDIPGIPGAIITAGIGYKKIYQLDTWFFELTLGATLVGIGAGLTSQGCTRCNVEQPGYCIPGYGLYCRLNPSGCNPTLEKVVELLPTFV